MMKQSPTTDQQTSQELFRCRCGCAFPVAPEDRGFSVYCPSCAQECQVPADFGDSEHAPVKQSAAPTQQESDAAATAVSQARSTVFSREELSHAASRTIGEIACLCGGKTPVSADDYGSTVYCSSCGAEIEVGERLGQTRHVPVSVAAPVNDVPLSGTVRRAQAAGKSEASTATVPIVAAVAGAIVLVIIAWVGAAHWPSSKSPGNELSSGTDLVLVPPPVAVGNAPKITAPETDDAPDEEPEPELVGDPADSITLERIEALLMASDKRSALLDAQIWRQWLIERGMSAGDARLKRLDEVIAILIEELTPKPPPPDPAIEAFRELLGRLHKALAAERLADARDLNRQATEMFRAHAQALAPYSRQFLMQQARLKKLEAQLEGLATVERLLNQALSDAEAGRVLEALEARATAFYMANEGCVSSDEEEARLRSLTAAQREPLRLARGKRAVDDAQRCQDAHDLAARNAQVQLARSLLPGLPESQIKPLMTTVEQLSKRAIAGSHRTPMGQELAARAAYEEALEHYGRGELPALVQAAAQPSEASAPPAIRQYHEKLAGIAFHALEGRLSAVVAGLVPPAERGAALSALEQACNQMHGWQDDTRYQALRAATEQQTGELAEKALAAAKRLAAEDQLTKAVAAVLPATQLGPAKLRAAAEKLRGEWQAEIDLRASRPAQDEHWQRIVRDAQSRRVVDAVREMRLFEQRYPKTPHQAELAALKSKLLPEINRELDALIKGAEVAWQRQQWAEFKEQFARLEPLAGAAGREADCAPLREKAAQLQARIAGHLEQAKRALRMVTDDEIIAVLNAARDVLSIHPDHAAAADLLKKAQTQATARAARLMKKAEGLRRNKLVNETYRKLLTSVVDLDRDGEQGRQAQLALDAIPGGPP